MRNGIWGQEPRSFLARGYQIVEFGTPNSIASKSVNIGDKM